MSQAIYQSTAVLLTLLPLQSQSVVASERATAASDYAVAVSTSTYDQPSQTRRGPSRRHGLANCRSLQIAA